MNSNWKLSVILWREYLKICLKVCSNQKWNKILFYLTVYVEDIRLTDIITRSEYVVDIWVLRTNRKMLISLVIFWNQLLAVARRINKQNDYTNYMFSIISIAIWLFSKVSTSPELGQIQNWQNNCVFGVFLVSYCKLRDGNSCWMYLDWLFRKFWQQIAGVSSMNFDNFSCYVWSMLRFIVI